MESDILLRLLPDISCGTAASVRADQKVHALEEASAQLPTVLAVEDEILIQELIVHALEDAGYHVETATTAREALAMLERNDARYQILLTDIDLGDKSSGWDVAHRARELRPEMPVIYVTGGGANEWPSQGVPNSVLIVKPFAPAQIVTAVSQLMNSTVARPPSVE